MRGEEAMAVSKQLTPLYKVIEQIAAGVRVLDFQSMPRLPQSVRERLLDQIGLERHRIVSLRSMRYERRIPKVSPTWLERPNRIWIEVQQRGPIVLERSLTGYRVRYADQIVTVTTRCITAEHARQLQRARGGRLIEDRIRYMPRGHPMSGS